MDYICCLIGIRVFTGGYRGLFYKYSNYDLDQ
jgi:hypothetical protein